MKPSPSSIDAARGVGLVELLVAVTLGMIASVAMFSILESAESRKRTSAGASDMEIAGVAGGYSIERELKLAGYGFARSGVLGCRVNAVSDAGTAFAFTLVPVNIVQGGAGPDTIEIVAGSSPILNDPVRYSGGTATTRDLANAAGFFAGEWILAASGSGASAACALARMSGLAGSRVTHVTMTGPASDGVAVGFGPAWQRSRWSVSGGRLLRTDLTQGDAAATAQEVSDVIVDLQAQYGYDTDGNGQVGAGEWVDTLPAAADPLRVIAVRFATLSRSGQFEKTVTTPQVPTWVGASTAGFTMTNLDGTADSGAPQTGAAPDPNNWRYYRYRVHQFVVPLRNLIWGRS